MHTDRCGNTRRQKCCAKGCGKEVKIQEFVYRDTTNVEPEMYDCTFIIIIIIIIIRYIRLLLQAFLPGTSLEPAVIPTAHASSFTLQYFPYYV